MDVVLITGCASGIGRATAQRFLDGGWKVYATDVDVEGLESLAGDRCETERMDVTDDDEVEAVLDLIAETEGRLDCLVNNAGVAQMGPIEDVPMNRIERQFDVNLYGTIRVIKEALPLLRDTPGSTIVNVSSTNGRVTTPGVGVYAASKHAIEGMSDALRMELVESGVDVCLLEPAWVSTGFLDQTHESIAGFDRTDVYDELYAALEGDQLLGGGDKAVSPDDVGEKIYSIAESSSPDPRYTVGLVGKVVLSLRFLPQSVYDWIQRRAVKQYAEEYRAE